MKLREATRSPQPLDHPPRCLPRDADNWSDWLRSVGSTSQTLHQGPQYWVLDLGVRETLLPPNLQVHCGHVAGSRHPDMSRSGRGPSSTRPLWPVSGSTLPEGIPESQVERARQLARELVSTLSRASCLFGLDVGFSKKCTCKTEVTRQGTFRVMQQNPAYPDGPQR